MQADKTEPIISNLLAGVHVHWTVHPLCVSASPLVLLYHDTTFYELG